MKAEYIETSGTQSHDCEKHDCAFCDIMNRPKRDDISFRKNGWSTNEIKYLLANYDGMTTKEIAKALNKTVGAVTTKKYYLNSCNTAVNSLG